VKAKRIAEDIVVLEHAADVEEAREIKDQVATTT
jgi:hypothetical protein